MLKYSRTRRNKRMHMHGGGRLDRIPVGPGSRNEEGNPSRGYSLPAQIAERRAEALERIGRIDTMSAEEKASLASNLPVYLRQSAIVKKQSRRANIKLQRHPSQSLLEAQVQIVDDFRDNWELMYICAHGSIEAPALRPIQVPPRTYIRFNAPSACAAIGVDVIPIEFINDDIDNFREKLSTDYLRNGDIFGSFSSEDERRSLYENPYDEQYCKSKNADFNIETPNACTREQETKSVYSPGENIVNLRLKFKNQENQAVIIGVYNLPITSAFYDKVKENDNNPDKLSDRDLFGKDPNIKPKYITHPETTLERVLRDLDPVPEGKVRFLFINACRYVESEVYDPPALVAGARNLNVIEAELRAHVPSVNNNFGESIHKLYGNNEDRALIPSVNNNIGESIRKLYGNTEEVKTLTELLDEYKQTASSLSSRQNIGFGLRRASINPNRVNLGRIHTLTDLLRKPSSRLTDEQKEIVKTSILERPYEYKSALAAITLYPVSKATLADPVKARRAAVITQLLKLEEIRYGNRYNVLISNNEYCNGDNSNGGNGNSNGGNGNGNGGNSNGNSNGGNGNGNGGNTGNGGNGNGGNGGNGNNTGNAGNGGNAGNAGNGNAGNGNAGNGNAGIGNGGIGNGGGNGGNGGNGNDNYNNNGTNGPVLTAEETNKYFNAVKSKIYVSLSEGGKLLMDHIENELRDKTIENMTGTFTNDEMSNFRNIYSKLSSENYEKKLFDEILDKIKTLNGSDGNGNGGNWNGNGNYNSNYNSNGNYNNGTNGPVLTAEETNKYFNAIKSKIYESLSEGGKLLMDHIENELKDKTIENMTGTFTRDEMYNFSDIWSKLSSENYEKKMFNEILDKINTLKVQGGGGLKYSRRHRGKHSGKHSGKHLSKRHTIKRRRH
jgi:hypothetical protein